MLAPMAAGLAAPPAVGGAADHAPEPGHASGLRRLLHWPRPRLEEAASPAAPLDGIRAAGRASCLVSGLDLGFRREGAGGAGRGRRGGPDRTSPEGDDGGGGAGGRGRRRRGRETWGRVGEE